MAYSNSDYAFSQPVRYYKANDPYYFEVDNLPIRQLEENILWVKDQVDDLLTPPSAEPSTGVPLFVGDDLDLEHVKQFRPRSLGSRNVKIQAGRFTARINDAYKVDDSLAQLTLSAISTITGANICHDLPKINQAQSVSFFDAVWDSYTKILTEEEFAACPGESNKALAYRSNGLETMYTLYLSNDNGFNLNTYNDGEGAPVPTASGTTVFGAPEYQEDGSGRGKTWPALWHGDFYNFTTVPNRTNWNLLNQIHLKVVQHWRGVARTSVVDFRGDSIEIPPFHEFDYYYTDGGGNDISLYDLATQRIDLLVVYSHPVDNSGTTLSEYNGVTTGTQNQGIPIGTPKKIVAPRIGLIRGAGIGLKRVNNGRIETEDKRIVPGDQKILANLNDHLDGRSNTGFLLSNGEEIHGSFPSPDDLANIAPNLTLSLTDSSLQLVGQTALPIAYVVVEKEATVISEDNIIDIRPFFRTTELAYNERAGIAAAQPPLSFANPAVGAAQLENQADCLRVYTEQQLDTLPTHSTKAHAFTLGVDAVGNSRFTLGQTPIAIGFGVGDFGPNGTGQIAINSGGIFRNLRINLTNIDRNGLTTAEIASQYAVVCSVGVQGGHGYPDGGSFAWAGDVTLKGWEAGTDPVDPQTQTVNVLVDVNANDFGNGTKYNATVYFMTRGGFDASPTTVLGSNLTV